MRHGRLSSGGCCYTWSLELTLILEDEVITEQNGVASSHQDPRTILFGVVALIES